MLSPSLTPVRWILDPPSESMKNNVALAHASKAQLEPKWNQKVSKSLQNGAKSRLKGYPKMGLGPFSVQKCRHAVGPVIYSILSRSAISNKHRF